MGPAEQWASLEARGVVFMVTAREQARTAKRLEGSRADKAGMWGKI